MVTRRGGRGPEAINWFEGQRDMRGRVTDSLAASAGCRVPHAVGATRSRRTHLRSPIGKTLVKMGLRRTIFDEGEW